MGEIFAYSGYERKTVRTGSNSLFAWLAFSPAGTKLAALGADNRIYIWTFADGNASRFLTFSLPDQVNNGRTNRTGWIAWVSEGLLAVALGSNTVELIRLEP
ncbi:hypothetical protein QCM77_45315 [Bradyrhizobium sp. SSUT18]|uniref:hypothetical protein n=1 Tax=Bradyrhizobium sp. SSUT18 TaxID=3040602 RepID=UPI00244AD85E|nr:hypothetical protein [Bradyrhizobium sp. SSUT18]MDH2406989.1 hypothetical protein [Bradyrhizobium sp. SSUT18]